MSALETYINSVQDTKGSFHMWRIQGLRKYIHMSTDEALTNAINMITDTNKLCVLIEAGMRTPLHQVVVSRMNMLIKEQEEAKK